MQEMLPGEHEFTLGRLLAAGLRPDRELLARSLAQMACDGGLMAPLSGPTADPRWKIVAASRPAAVLQAMAADLPAEASLPGPVRPVRQPSGAHAPR
ncbi:hypothetical protein [Actinomadura sp. KC216]|uniref:hypothetical protein n=1 Tax=Actinomadura sp. KC216 TaxID=2530370 RepID=UPI0014045FB9|nr:hypothetical protein [Actinomadura sp. KC216]